MKTTETFVIVRNVLVFSINQLAFCFESSSRVRYAHIWKRRSLVSARSFWNWGIFPPPVRLSIALPFFLARTTPTNPLINQNSKKMGAEAGPSRLPQKKRKPVKHQVRSSKVKKLSEAKAIELLEKAALEYVSRPLCLYLFCSSLT